MEASYRDLQLPDARGVDGERRRQPQARVQRIAIDIWDPAKSHPEPKSQHRNQKRENPMKSAPEVKTLDGRRVPTEVGELRGAALELELVAGEGLEPVLERVLQRPRYNRLHLPRLPECPGRFPWSGAAAGTVCPASVVARRRIGGEIPARWRKRGRGRRWRGGPVEGCEKRWWALLGLGPRLLLV